MQSIYISYIYKICQIFTHYHSQVCGRLEFSIFWTLNGVPTKSKFNYRNKVDHTQSQRRDANTGQFALGDRNDANWATLLLQTRYTPQSHLPRKLKNVNSSGKFT